jgi:hypothetical protein
MPPTKNEHLIWALGEKSDGSGFVLVIGITDMGMKTLIDRLTLLVNPPKGMQPITNVVFFHEKDKETLRLRFQETGVPIREEDFRDLQES